MLSNEDKVDITKMISASLSTLGENVDFIRIIVEHVTSAVQEVFNKKIKGLQDEINSLKVTNSELKESSNSCAKKADDLEQYTRRNNIRIFGLPESDSENIDDVVINLFNEKLNVNITPSEIDRCHRLGKKTNNKSNRPVIVKFTSYRSRHLVFATKKSLKGSGITIREDLTKSRLALLKAAADKVTFKNAWTSDGRVIVNLKKRGRSQKVYINSIIDINNL